MHPDRSLCSTRKPCRPPAKPQGQAGQELDPTAAIPLLCGLEQVTGPEPQFPHLQIRGGIPAYERAGKIKWNNDGVYPKFPLKTCTSFYFSFFIYLAALGLTHSMQDL